MESESDDGKAGHSKVKGLVKKFTDDKNKPDNMSGDEGKASDNENDDDDDDDESIQSRSKKMKPDLEDDETNDNLDEEEEYVSAQDNDDDSEDRRNKTSDVDDEESENNLVEEKEDIEVLENNDDDDDGDRMFRRGFKTIWRSRTSRRHTNNTKPEEMSGDVEHNDSIENDDNDSALKWQQSKSDVTETKDNSDNQEVALNASEVVEDEIKDILNNEEVGTLLGDEVTEEESNDNLDEQGGILDSSLDIDDSMVLKARKSYNHTDDIDTDDVVSDKEEDVTIEDKYYSNESTLNVRLEREDSDEFSDEDEPETILEEKEDDESTNNYNSTRFHQIMENKVHEEEDASENNDDEDSTTVQEEKLRTEDDLLHSYIFKDPIEDLKALRGRIVKDALVFQRPLEEMPPLVLSPSPESDKYYEDENDIQEPPSEGEPEEPLDFEARNLQPKEEKQVLSESEEEEESILRINTNALGKASHTYELERFEKNALIIFHQEWIPGQERRKGSIKDAKDLANTFEKFGFEISAHIDQTKDEIFRKLEEFAATDFSDYGCVSVAVMTHGSGGYLRAKDRQYHETHIINYFKSHSNPTLVTKPKVIIIQACRGKKVSPAVLVNQAISPLGIIMKDHDEYEQYTLPTESDILVLHSTYAGNPSHRDEIYGTWFIQTLCKKIEDLAKVDDLESIYTEVQREVAIDKEHKEWNMDTKKDEIGKQMPVKMSTLTRKLYLSYKNFARDNPEMNSQIQQDMMAKAAVRRDSSFSCISTSHYFTPCACFLEKFLYLTICMRYFVEDNPEDESAKSFLEMAESLGDGRKFNKLKEISSRSIINHLKANADKCEFYKYLYL